MKTSTHNKNARHASEARRSRGAETRARILAVAARLFRKDGIDAVGVDAVMREAGLTHGGFYTHFASKEALVAEVAALVMRRSGERWQAIARENEAGAGYRKLVLDYLGMSHVAAPDHGCPLTALGPEIARRPAARAGVTEGMRAMLDALERCIPAGGAEEATSALCTMVGAVVLARISDDPTLSETILSAARTKLLTPG
ncbi:MAG TPA: helix-turn-helix domain-containing protein [Acetobacteraceae bacterium]|nr:helix-turn-helix domain-containing protein [Acetobacteraceae bacterium]